MSESSDSHDSEVIRCQICDEPGHKPLDCWNSFDDAHQEDEIREALPLLHVSDDPQAELLPHPEAHNPTAPACAIACNACRLAEPDAQSEEGRQQRIAKLQEMLDLLAHASHCRSLQCLYPNCRKVKGLFRHGMQCSIRASGGCVLCKRMWYLLQVHATACKESSCPMPRCRDIKERLRRSQK